MLDLLAELKGILFWYFQCLSLLWKQWWSRITTTKHLFIYYSILSSRINLFLNIFHIIMHWHFLFSRTIGSFSFLSLFVDEIIVEFLIATCLSRNKSSFDNSGSPIGSIFSEARSREIREESGETGAFGSELPSFSASSWWPSYFSTYSIFELERAIGILMLSSSLTDISITFLDALDIPLTIDFDSSSLWLILNIFAILFSRPSVGSTS